MRDAAVYRCVALRRNRKCELWAGMRVDKRFESYVFTSVMHWHAPPDTAAVVAVTTTADVQYVVRLMR